MFVPFVFLRLFYAEFAVLSTIFLSYHYTLGTTSRWTLQMLADEMVELEIIESVSASTVQRTLKKTNLSRISGSSG